MKLKNWVWIILCILFFLCGFFISKVTLYSTATTVITNNSKQTAISFSIPQVPLPADWSSKKNLPGNTFDTAFTLNPGIKTQGTFNTSNAIDYYTFDLKDPSQIAVDVTDVPKALFWVLYDSSQKEVASTYRTGSMGGSTQIALNNPGKYYIKVWADYHELVNYPYTIRLSILPYFE